MDGRTGKAIVAVQRAVRAYRDLAVVVGLAAQALRNLSPTLELVALDLAKFPTDDVEPFPHWG